MQNVLFEEPLPEDSQQHTSRDYYHNYYVESINHSLNFLRRIIHAPFIEIKLISLNTKLH